MLGRRATQIDTLGTQAGASKVVIVAVRYEKVLVFMKFVSQ